MYESSVDTRMVDSIVVFPQTILALGASAVGSVWRSFGGDSI